MFKIVNSKWRIRRDYVNISELPFLSIIKSVSVADVFPMVFIQTRRNHHFERFSTFLDERLQNKPFLHLLLANYAQNEA